MKPLITQKDRFAFGRETSQYRFIADGMTCQTLGAAAHLIKVTKWTPDELIHTAPA